MVNNVLLILIKAIVSSALYVEKLLFFALKLSGIIIFTRKKKQIYLINGDLIECKASAIIILIVLFKCKKQILIKVKKEKLRRRHHDCGELHFFFCFTCSVVGVLA